MAGKRKSKAAQVGGNQADNPSDDLPTDYWGIVAEIDATIFCIEQLAKQKVTRKPIERVVDEATGYNAETDATLEYWSKRLKLLVKLLPPDDWHFKQADAVVTDLAAPHSDDDTQPVKSA